MIFQCVVLLYKSYVFIQNDMFYDKNISIIEKIIALVDLGSLASFTVLSNDNI